VIIPRMVFKSIKVGSPCHYFTPRRGISGQEGKD
jgi:hypothetical protein